MLSRLLLAGQVALRELKRISSAPLYMFCMIVAPLLTMGFLLSLMSNGLPTEMPIAIVDQDNSTTSRALYRTIDAFSQSEVVLRTTSFEEARIAMQQGKVYSILFIPKGFARSVVTATQVELSYYSNNGYLMAGGLTYRDLKMLSEMVNGKAILEGALARGQQRETTMARIQPIRVESEVIGNKWLNYSIYLNNILIPGVLQLMIFLVTVYSIGIEIKDTTSREWLRMGGGSISLSLLGKLSVHTLVYFAVGLMCLGLMYGVSAFPLLSGIGPMLLALILLIIASQALAVVFISVLPTLRLGLSLASLVGMVSFSAVGFTFPVSAMHPTLQALTYIFPLRHYFLIHADQALAGRPFYFSILPYISLVIFTLLPMLTMRQLKRALLEFRYIP